MSNRTPVLDLRVLPPHLLRGGNLSFYLGIQPPIPTGVESLDRILSGGWPRYVISYLQGEEASGKSSLCEEAILQFFRSEGGVAIVACLQGDHPLPGFWDRLSESETQRLFLIHPNSIENSFSMARSIIQDTLDWGKEYLFIVDDLPSLCQTDSPSSAVGYAINKIRPYLHRVLTVLLVNQVRERSFEEVVGATSYWRTFTASEVALHLGASVEGLGGSIVSKGCILKPASLLGSEFEVSITPGVGITPWA